MSCDMRANWQKFGLGIYLLGDAATFVFLTFLDGYRYNMWNWLIAVPINFFLAQIWPIYWLILRPLFGH
jgi:hypothetical protein